MSRTFIGLIVVRGILAGSVAGWAQTNLRKQMLLRSLYVLLLGCFAFAFMSLVCTPPCDAVPAAPTLHVLQQPDGLTFQARQWGDEFLHGWETEDGYTILYDASLGSWTYAIVAADGSLASSFRLVGRDDRPEGVSRRLRPTGPRPGMIRPMKLGRELWTSAYESLTLPQGTYDVPVILVNFSDTVATYDRIDFQTLLFGSGNHSLKDYYEEVSYGKFSVSAGPSGVVGWYKAKGTHDYYGRNDADGEDMWPGTLVRETVAAADAEGFNWVSFDNDGDCYVDAIMIVNQGTGESSSGRSTDIWPHSWSLNSAFRSGYSDGGEFTTRTPCATGGFIKVNKYTIQPEIVGGGLATIGVYAHEFAHALGLPDLYDTDYTSEGVGNWSLMAGGGHNKVSRDGDRPAQLDAWSKYRLGWLAPTKVSATLTNQAIPQVETVPTAYQLLDGDPANQQGEYFLVENRQKVGFDEGLPGSGLLVWHVDESKFNNDEECFPGGPSCATRHFKIALVQADNLWNLEKDDNEGDPGDPYPGSWGNTSFTGSSSPNSNLYNGTPSNVSVTDISSSGSTMTATLSVEGGSPATYRNLLMNPDFELGPWYWVQESISGYSVIYQGSANENWFAWLGGYNYGLDLVYQDVTIPSDATAVYLNFFYSIETDETAVYTAYDLMGADVYDPRNAFLLRSVTVFSNLDNTYGVWTLSGLYDLSEFKGQTIRLAFWAETDASAITNFFIDAIGLWALIPPIGPDLTGSWSSFYQTCSSSSRGQKCKINGSLRIDNIGNRAAASTYVSFYLSDDGAYDTGDTLLKSVSTGKINPGGFKNKSLKYTLPVGSSATGKYVIAVIDEGHGVTEINEGNNRIVFGPIP